MKGHLLCLYFLSVISFSVPCLHNLVLILYQAFNCNALCGRCCCVSSSFSSSSFPSSLFTFIILFFLSSFPSSSSLLYCSSCPSLPPYRLTAESETVPYNHTQKTPEGSYFHSLVENGSKDRPGHSSAHPCAAVFQTKLCA